MDIVILGAGIGGLCSAIALAQKGIRSVVYERKSVLENVGAGIVCWPNASFVLDRLGVLDAVKTLSSCPENMHRLTPQGESLGSMNIGFINQIMGYASYSILRKDLMRILFNRVLELGIEVRFDHCAIDIEWTKQISQIEFSNGKRLSADVIIGADGRMQSLSRGIILGDNAPVFQQFINWVGVYETETPIFDSPDVLDSWGVGTRFGIVPVSGTKAYWAGGCASSSIKGVEPENYQSENYQNELLDLFNDWRVPFASISAEQIIKDTAVSDIHKVYVHDHNPTDIWYKHNLLMMGDAAHASLPTSGQGACQAMEDAWVLAEMISQDARNNSVPITSVFKAFTESRYSKTSSIIQSGRQLAKSLFNTDEDYCQQRNLQSKQSDFDQQAVAIANGWSSGLAMF